MELLTDKSKRNRWLRDNNSVLILVVLLCLAFFCVDGFSNGFYNVITYSAQFGLCCIGLSFILITGNIDLSIGYAAGSAGITLVIFFNWVYGATRNEGIAFLVGCIAAILAGCFCGALNGFFVTKVGISPLIATIASNYIFQGYAYNFAASTFAPDARTAVQWIHKTRILGFKWFTPMVIIVLCIFAIVFFLMYKTRFGNSLYIAGDNPEAADYAGIGVKKTVFKAFLLGGLFAGLTGIMLIAFNGGAIYTQGSTLGTFPIACCVLGGIKMKGGKGTMVHVLLGTLIMRTVSQIMTAFRWQTTYVDLATGIILIVVLLIDRFTTVKKVGED